MCSMCRRLRKGIPEFVPVVCSVAGMTVNRLGDVLIGHVLVDGVDKSSETSRVGR